MFGLSILASVLLGVSVVLMVLGVLLSSSSREGSVVSFIVGLIVGGIFIFNNPAFLGISLLHAAALYSGVGVLVYAFFLVVGLFKTYFTFSGIRSRTDEMFNQERADFIILADSLLANGSIQDKAIQDKLVDKLSNFINRFISDNELSMYVVETIGVRKSRRGIINWMLLEQIAFLEKNSFKVTGTNLAAIFDVDFFSLVKTHLMSDASKSEFNPMRGVLAMALPVRDKNAAFVIAEGENISHFFNPTLSLHTNKTELAEMAGSLIIMWPLEILDFVLSGVIKNIANMTARMIRGTLGKILISPLK